MFINIINKFFSKKESPSNKEILLESSVSRKNPSGIRTVIVTDLHGTAWRITDEELADYFSDYDLCLILGDCYSNDIERILPYLDLAKTYAVYGNHNDYADRQYEKYGITNIHGKSFELGDKIFVGWEGSFKYKSSVIGMTQEESVEFEKSLPDRCDYLVSHDGLYCEGNSNTPHAGLIGITNYQNRTGCFVLRGHLHNRYENNNEQCFYKIERVIL